MSTARRTVLHAKELLAMVAAVAALLGGAHMAEAGPVDFSTILATPGGDLNVSTYTYGGIKADSFYWNGSAYVQAGTTLFVRNDAADDVGLGVCGPSDGNNGGCGTSSSFGGGGGDYNELDNAGSKELIRLTLPSGETWVSVSLSSLDCNGSGACSDPESGQLRYGSSASDLNSLLPGILFQQFAASSGGNVNPTIAIATVPAQTATYLYFIPKHGDDNDYLVWRATTEGGGGGSTEVPTVPAPGTLMLVALGLPGLSAAIAIRRSRRP